MIRMSDFLSSRPTLSSETPPEVGNEGWKDGGTSTTPKFSTDGALRRLLATWLGVCDIR